MLNEVPLPLVPSHMHPHSGLLILTVNSSGLQLPRRDFLCKHEDLQSNLQHACTMQNMTAQACKPNAEVRNRPVRVFVGLSAKVVSFIFNERSYLKGIRWKGRKEDAQHPFQASACSYMTVCAGSLMCITTHTPHTSIIRQQIDDLLLLFFL